VTKLGTPHTFSVHSVALPKTLTPPTPSVTTEVSSPFVASDFTQFASDDNCIYVFRQESDSTRQIRCINAKNPSETPTPVGPVLPNSAAGLTAVSGSVYWGESLPMPDSDGHTGIVRCIRPFPKAR